MNFTRRVGTTQAKISPERFKELELQFLQDIVDVMKMEDIPPQLIFNWDQTGLNLVPASNWTMAQMGQKRIQIKGLKDKRMITAVFCGSLIHVGEFLPMQLIYRRKTDKCHPPVAFPDDWDTTHNENHWQMSLQCYIQRIIVPFIERVRSDINVEPSNTANYLFSFSGHFSTCV